ncbi:twin-arginine translocase subunit TatC [Paenibacillus alginolyticus]|uniref:Sec-independent protein translocase protein TatC n=1 Tax=Paenibacillus alginolyticus TaxID=59839 RepID=A0ABT4GIC6_9BACL|nr:MULTISPECIES: twin-arginine translocase subunit TatC [Paenibacillus]MCY9663860.1 twin-arginine translocase subunit TatC [Paenibacillus alginolyticus]MCY9695778.1 twin-arginine translocase subunit TatC [Paenibacillus alginolyticus]MEC0142316.1 twin-arginine translocase subunit TatC [Paenibacillus alginolyticus]NRF90467.1 twin-arginine translocase subunit TatC [Paenibacillus frigoriresistens]
MEQEDWIFHLTEVRKRLLIVFAWFVVTLSVGLYVSPRILRYMKSQPLVGEINWNVFSFTDGLMIYMKCAFLVALLFTVPVLLYQVWAFVRPGLTDAEAKSTLPYIPVSFALFIIGVSFSYWVVFPMMIRFMIRMNHTVGAVETYGIDRYFSFLFEVVFPMAIAFELPVVVLFLTRIGLLTPQRLKMTRKYAYVGLAIIGSCISPPDMISHLSVTVPLILLFEISVMVAGWQWRTMQESPANS